MWTKIDGRVRIAQDGTILESELCHSVPCTFTVTPSSNPAVLCSNPLESRNRWMQSNDSPLLPARGPAPSDESKVGSSGSPGRQAPTARAPESSSAGCFPSVRNLIQKDKLKGQWSSLTFPSTQRPCFKSRHERQPHLPTPLPRAP